MTAMIDIIIVGIIALTIVMAVQRGFVRTVLGTLGFTLALVVAIAFRSPVSTAFQDSAVGDKMEGLVHSAIDNTVTEANYEQIFNTEASNEAEASLKQVFFVFGAEDKFEDIKEDYDQWRTDGVLKVREQLKAHLTEPGVKLCCDVLAYLIIFIIARIIIKIIEIVLDKVVALPVLRQANKALGAAAGVVLAVFRVFLLCFVLKLVLPIAGGMGIEWIANINPDNSVLYRLFDSGNFLAGIL